MFPNKVLRLLFSYHTLPWRLYPRLHTKGTLTRTDTSNELGLKIHTRPTHVPLFSGPIPFLQNY